MSAYCYTDLLLPLPLQSTFTYAVNAEKASVLKPGMRVLVPFGKKKTYTALVLSVHHNKPENYEIREITDILDTHPVVLESQLVLWKWISEYYMCTLGEVFKAALPAQLNILRKPRKKKPDAEKELTNPAALNTAQAKALNEINACFAKTDVVLLHGVTSSGKTEIYIHLIHEALKEHKQVLYLLPEIALTTQIITRLRAVFGSIIAVYHSKYSDSERIKVWNDLVSEDSNNIKVVLGVRSAIFLPFSNLGLIIVDEEHENTYKQFDPAPRYHARDTAIMLARNAGAKVLLGTATPSVETYYNCVKGKYGLVELNERYLNLKLPEITIENTRELRKRKKMNSHFSPALLDLIRESLANQEQVILFQNRRGFSIYLECEQCGEIPRCKYCDVSLTYHKRNNQLYCHYCGYHTHIPAVCPSCNSGQFSMRGFGTEKIEEEIAILFPEARIERLDLDSVRSRKSYEKLIARFEMKQSDILVGTQMVSKGLDFDNVKVVGIMNADNMLNFPDFRAHERSYQLMSQVSGRSGRKNSQGKVIIQTSAKNHAVIAHVINHDYLGMFHDEIEERKRFRYPPFSRLIEITIKHRDKTITDSAAAFLATKIKQLTNEKVMGPEDPLISRIQSLYLKRILIKAEKGNLSLAKNSIGDAISEMKTQAGFAGTVCTIDVDPY